MTSPAEKMREAAADWCAGEADSCDDAAKWGGHRKYVQDCKAAAYALRNAASKIRALPLPPEPPVEAMARALEAAMDALADSQWSGGSAERRCAAALAEYEAWKKGAG